MKKDESVNPWVTENIKEVYQNNWIKVSHEDVITPAGNKGIYGKVHFKNLAIGILPLDKEYNTWIVGQYRYPLKEYSWEIPEGGSPMGTAPLISAKRELQEETGIQANKWTEVLRLTTSNSVTDERAISYVAQDLTFGEATPEETEELQILKIPFFTLFQKVMNGEITDAISVATILKVHQLIERGEI